MTLYRIVHFIDRCEMQIEGDVIVGTRQTIKINEISIKMLNVMRQKKILLQPFQIVPIYIISSILIINFLVIRQRFRACK